MLHRSPARRTTLALVAASALLAAAPGRAATLIVSGGQLLGATGVDVGGNLFDVAFVDGTCIAVFGGCDQQSDFTFQSQAAAVVASQALLDQVFLDGGSGAFDTDPELTAGCSQFTVCTAMTPWDAFPTSPGGWVASAVNRAPPNTDYTAGSSTVIGTQDMTGATANVWAVWTAAVPEPSAPLLLASALLGLGLRGRLP